MVSKLQAEVLNNGTGRITISGYTRYLHIAPKDDVVYDDPATRPFDITSDDHLTGAKQTLDTVEGFAAAIVAAISLMVHLARKDGIDMTGFPDSVDWP